MGATQVNPRVVFDTNVVVSALLFRTGRLAWLRLMWPCLTPLVCRETVAELMRVLLYPKFKLDHESMEVLLAEYLPWAVVSDIANLSTTLPLCSDVDDQMFLQLADSGKADYLVTGDRDLLIMDELFPFQIVTPEVFKQLVT